MPVRQLSEATINRIAAGEVIERPASVVKELVENALDAGAGKIDVLTDGGGRRLIRITDDGAGMTRADLALAVERHATSKLDEEDLLAIRTLGFRGEALPSIGAAACMTITTRHKSEPHAYGISYFSSRGPTADGRIKPDLVAPGERIVSCLPDEEKGPLDGTSQAAPHVSAAAAMLMARYPELNREPRRIKQILCESATDLGRERAFQGHGLLDILRALQSF